MLFSQTASRSSNYDEETTFLTIGQALLWTLDVPTVYQRHRLTSVFQPSAVWREETKRLVLLDGGVKMEVGP